MVRAGKLYKRHEVRPGKSAPPDFELIATDPETEKQYGWVQVGWGSEDKYFREAIIEGDDNTHFPDGTYELLGPKVQGNPEDLHKHFMQKHDHAQRYNDVPTEFEALKEWLSDHNIEGIVWHHPDGRMVKIKKRDFRLKRTQ